MKTLFKYVVQFLTIIFITTILVSCKKFLDKKSDETLSTPQTLDDLQALIDNQNPRRGLRMLLNSTDEYYVPESVLNTQTNIEIYTWDPDFDNITDWNIGYNSVFYANTILDNLKNISPSGQETRWNNIKASALFIRAIYFYQLAQLFARQYDPATAATDLGIPLRLNSNFNEVSTRSSVKETYDRIINDLNEAAKLFDNTLPTTPLTKFRPTKAACFGLLARTNLQIGRYQEAKNNADSCLSLYRELLNFNNTSDVNTSLTNPILRFNREVIFYLNTTATLNGNSLAKVDSNIVALFTNANDRRRAAFFVASTQRFKGSYNGTFGDLFSGIATNEILLIRAESNARLLNVSAAVADLDSLRIKRWTNGMYSYLSQTITTPTQALQAVLDERRRELIYRGTRWSDLKRLNKEPGFEVTIRRVLQTLGTFTLPPNDPRYTLLIPIEVINFTNMPQNPR